MNHRFPRRGFTLLEMIAATLIVAMLGAATLMICRSLMRQAMPLKGLTADAAAPSYLPRLRQTLERDLAEASEIYAGNNQVIFEGPMPSRPDLGNRGHRPMQIVWKIERKPQDPARQPGALPMAMEAPQLLIREQTDVLDGTLPRREIVLEGVDRLEVREISGHREWSVTGPALPGGLRVSVETRLNGNASKKIGGTP